MKRDMATIRKILLHIETNDSFVRLEDGDDEERSQRAIYHLRLMGEAGLIGPVNVDFSKVDSKLVLRSTLKHAYLTWEGHDLLDSIRDDTVWQRTKERLAYVGGSAALVVWKSAAAEVAKNLITRAGLE